MDEKIKPSVVDIYVELREFLHDNATKILDNTVDSVEGDDYIVQYLGVTVSIDTNKVKNKEEFDKIYKYHLVKIATYLNALADLNLLKKGKLSAIRMDLYPTLGCDRFMFLVYPAFDKDMTREKLNEILKIDPLVINTGIVN